MNDRKELFVIFGVPVLGIVLCAVLFGLLIQAENEALSEPIEGTVFGKQFVPETCNTVFAPVNNMLVPAESCSPERYYLKIREEGSDQDVPIRVTRDDFSNYDFGDYYSRNTND